MGDGEFKESFEEDDDERFENGVADLELDD